MSIDTIIDEVKSYIMYPKLYNREETLTELEKTKAKIKNFIEGEIEEFGNKWEVAEESGEVSGEFEYVQFKETSLFKHLKSRLLNDSQVVGNEQLKCSSVSASPDEICENCGRTKQLHNWYKDEDGFMIPLINFCKEFKPKNQEDKA